ncbi:hypothetical protein [Tropicimonas sp. S265A]|uniref:hypothetical protein n=1 Tax=Tropicimonas sp. S265A TaxID=3415134 RepID=UPI003C7B35E3
MRPLEGHAVADFAQRLRQDNADNRHKLLVVDACANAADDAICVTQIDPDFLDTRRPEVVLTPLVSATFDAVEVAEALWCAGFTGELIVMAGPLPRPKLVESELRAVAPGVTLTLNVPSKAAAAH